MKRVLVFALSIYLTASTVLLAVDVSGKVINKESGNPLGKVVVKILETGKIAVTDSKGNFIFKNLSEGEKTFYVKENGFQKYKQKVEVSSDKELNIELDYQTYKLDDLEVTASSKKLEKITESPGAIDVLYANQIKEKSRSNQIGAAFEGMTGVEVLRSGTTDFTVNTRGFTNTMNKRVLVLQDGRENSLMLLSAQEWNSFQLPVDEFETIEFVRGPNAALYGANAFNGVINMKSYAPRDVLGGKVSFTGGDYETGRLDVRYAGLITDELSYKVTAGYSHSLNLSRSRDDSSDLEYPGLQVERRPLADDDRQTFAKYGTLRMDYDFDIDKRVVAEFGWSNSGNDIYSFNLGRVLVKDLYKPYGRLEYNSKHLNIHAHYTNRYSKDSIWFLVPNFYTMNDEVDMMVDAQYNFYADQDENMHIIIGTSFDKQMLEQYRTLTKDIDANFFGAYGQLTWNLSDDLKFVASGRLDESNVHDAFFSPRAALVYDLDDANTLRFSISSSFQRPNYNEYFRWSPIRPALAIGNTYNNGKGLFDYSKLQKVILDSISVLSGMDASGEDLGLIDSDPINPEFVNNLPQPISRAVGNPDLRLEKNLGYEVGYKGIISDKLYLTVDVYYNHIKDFVTVFVPNANSNLKKWEAKLSEDFSAYDQLATDMVYEALKKYANAAPLVELNGMPLHALSNGNIGSVDQYGLELGANYYFTDNLKFTLNYMYYNADIKLNPGDPMILPNTPPHRFNMALSYEVPQEYDISLHSIYVDEYEWLAGIDLGKVPSYTLFNLSAGYYVTNELNAGIYIYNLFNVEHYQVFGGSFIPRLSTFKITYNF